MAGMKLNTAVRLGKGAAAIPRHCWTTDRCGRLLAGGAIAICLAAGFWCPAEQTLAWALAGLVAVELVLTALLGWCPFHELMKRMGIPDREEVYARLVRQ